MAGKAARSITSVGLLGVAVLFLVVNMLSGLMFTSIRADLTENRLYTLTEGTRNILGRIQEPITLYLFYSDKASENVPQLRKYATRVRELLQEYVALSKGQVVLNFIDPLPYSEQEDRASALGLQGVPLGGTGEKIYFGLAASNAVGETETIKFFQPQREQFLEYDISRLIYNLSSLQKPVIGIHTLLPLFGGFDIETTRMTTEWALIPQLRQSFQVKQLDVTSGEIGDEIDILMVVHPKNLSTGALYSIDQFVMRGGKAMFFVDPHSEIDMPLRQEGTPLEVEGGRSSNVTELFDAWGIEYDPAYVVLDRRYALTVNTGDQGQARHYALLAVRDRDLSSEDVVSSELELVSFGVTGHVGVKEDAGIRFMPIVTSSQDAALVKASRFRFLPDLDQLSAGFEPTGKSYVLMGRVQGALSSAFPEGRPDAESNEQAVDGATHLAGTTGDANLVIVADTDILGDSMWVQVQDFFGQKIFNAWADNGALIANVLDNLAGSSDLISIRGRETSSRPFLKVNELRLAADQKFRATEESLQARLKDTEAKLVSLQKQRDDANALVLSAEQEEEIQKFQEEKLRIRKELRQVRHNLNLDIERLGTTLKFINIGLVPLIISILALALAIVRSRKRKHALGI